MPDELDRALVHALHVDARAPYARIGAVLGVSTQTVARRYRRLRADLGLRVVGRPDPAGSGRAQWLVRVTASPRSALDVAQALARRDDTTWVKLTSGGTEIVVIVDAPAAAAGRQPLLLRDLPRTASVSAVSAHYVLHTYLGGPTPWARRLESLDEDQVRRLAAPEPPAARAGAQVTAADAGLFELLGRDGRAGLADLAAATGRSAATIARRLAALRGSGALWFDVEVDAAALGGPTQALLWLNVAPAHLDQVGTALARHAELAFVAATTGRTSLVAVALCADPEALHGYLTGPLAAQEGIAGLETAPVLDTLKATGPVAPAYRRDRVPPRPARGARDG